MRILVDMDGVIADFEKKFLDDFRRIYPEKPFVPLEQRTTFYASDQYPEDLHSAIKDIMNAENFYLSMPPVEGGLEALSEMKRMGHDVYICTSPKLSSPYCLKEKLEWVERHLGGDWAKKMIIAKDKTVVIGDYLIDDRPEVRGIAEPTWEHVLYDRTYNANIDRKRLTWNDWKPVLGLK